MKTGAFAILAITLLGTVIAGARPTPESPPQFDLDVQEVFTALGDYEWRVLKNESYSRLAIGGATMKGHRIVATCRMPVDDQSKASSRLIEELERQLDAAGARMTGEESVAHAASVPLDAGGREEIEIEVPRWYYAIGRSHGILDASFVGHDGRVVMTVSYVQ